MNKLTLNIDNKTTSILIGRELSGKLSEISGSRIVLLIDENVYRLHQEKYSRFNCITIPEGEIHKTVMFAENLCRKMVDLEVDRSSFLVGVGGGLVTDVAGFTASVYMRGIPYGFISTTLLGQVDASIGGKNGVNLDGYKNMIGVIRQPEFVWCDLDLLDTLDKRELSSGFAEVIKYGCIRDIELFKYIETNYEAILSLENDPLERVVTKSAAIKAAIVQNDVNEKGERKLLNYGHTLGHAIEKLTGVLHGEAVGIGMVMASRLSSNLGFIKSEYAHRIEKVIGAAGLPVSTDRSPEQLFDTLLKDKKRAGGTISFILLKEIGKAFIKEIPLSELKKMIHDLY